MGCYLSDRLLVLQLLRFCFTVVKNRISLLYIKSLSLIDTQFDFQIHLSQNI